MARRTLATLADLLEDRVDKSRQDTTFDSFVQNMLILSLQEINAEVPWARWLMDEVSLVSTVSGIQYIVMPSDLDIDSMISITDRSNANIKVRRITFEEADLIDPGRELTGDEILWWYQRVETTSPAFEDRIYFIGRPESADTLSAIFGITVPQPTAAQTSVLPEKYEPYWMEGALSKIWERLDPDSQRSEVHKKEFRRGLEIIRRDANSGDNGSLASHRPLRGSGVSGPSWPAQFDITP